MMQYHKSNIYLCIYAFDVVVIGVCHNQLNLLICSRSREENEDQAEKLRRIEDTSCTNHRCMNEMTKTRVADVQSNSAVVLRPISVQYDEVLCVYEQAEANEAP